jgi:hypothetical protein
MKSSKLPPFLHFMMLLIMLVCIPASQAAASASLQPQPASLAEAHYPSRFLWVQPHLGDCGSPITAEALLQAKQGSTWQPAAGQQVYLRLKDAGGGLLDSNSGLTGADGVVTTTLTVTAGAAFIEAQFMGDPSHSINPTSLEETFTLSAPCQEAADLAVLAASGTYGGLVSLQATLQRASDGLPLDGRFVSFMLNGRDVGSALSDSNGLAQLDSTSLLDIPPGVYPGASGSGVGALFAGDADTFPITATATLTVTKASQTILLTPPVDTLAYNQSVQVSALASSGLPISLSVAGPCNSTGMLVTMSASSGDCLLTLEQPGDEYFLPADPLTHTLHATKADQTITFDPPASPQPYGVTFSVAPTASSGLLVEISVEGSCSLEGNQVSITSGAGACLIHANQSGDQNYNSAPEVARIVSAIQAVQTITFDPPQSPQPQGSRFDLTASASSGLPVSFSTSGSCEMQSQQVHITAPQGLCTLTASQPGDLNFLPAPDVTHTVQAVPYEGRLFLAMIFMRP